MQSTALVVAVIPAAHIFPGGHALPAVAQPAREFTPVFVYILPGGHFVGGVIPSQ